MDRFPLMGLSSGFFTTAALLPQDPKTWKIKSTKAPSLGMFSVFCTGIVLWLTHEILAGVMLMIFTDVVTMALAFSILSFKPSFKD